VQVSTQLGFVGSNVFTGTTNDLASVMLHGDGSPAAVDRVAKRQGPRSALPCRSLASDAGRAATSLADRSGKRSERLPGSPASASRPLDSPCVEVATGAHPRAPPGLWVPPAEFAGIRRAQKRHQPGTCEPTADASTEAQAISSTKRWTRPPRASGTKESESGESMLVCVAGAAIAAASAPTDEKIRRLWHHHVRPD
jgi:hypothetical protein